MARKIDGEASLHDMKRVDVWAYAMVVFCIVNPGLKHPYQRNVEDYSEEHTPNCLVQKFIEKNEKPLFQEKYASRHQEEKSLRKLRKDFSFGASRSKGHCKDGTYRKVGNYSV